MIFPKEETPAQGRKGKQHADNEDEDNKFVDGWMKPIIKRDILYNPQKISTFYLSSLITIFLLLVSLLSLFLLLGYNHSSMGLLVRIAATSRRLPRKWKLVEVLEE